MEVGGDNKSNPSHFPQEGRREKKEGEETKGEFHFQRSKQRRGKLRQIGRTRVGIEAFCSVTQPVKKEGFIKAAVADCCVLCS